MRLAFLFLFVSSIASAQNLLMNGSFEDENICPEYIQNCAPEGWISTSLWGDYFFIDPKEAYDGSSFVGIMFSKGPGKDTKAYKFVRSRLLCGLRSGAQYKLEVYIKSAQKNIDSLGVYFSADDIIFRKESIVHEEPQLWLSDGLEKFTPSQWQKTMLIYTAEGTENFIAIGDFRDEAHVFNSFPGDSKDFYFFIDRISLLPLDPNESLCPDAASVRQQEYKFDIRHNMLEKLVHARKRNPPPPPVASKTIVRRVDTLVLPDVLFASGSATLSSDANRILDDFLGKLSGRHIDSLVVEGHADSTGSSQVNQKLSLGRAQSVTAYLQSHLSQKVVARGMGSFYPIASNKTPEGRKLNRRVEIYCYLRE